MEPTNSKNSTSKSDPADLILVNGRIATQDGRGSFASALAIRGDRFAAVGDEGSIAALRGPGTRVIEAGGRTLIPGLKHSHIHVIRGGAKFSLAPALGGRSPPPPPLSKPRQPPPP